MNQTELLPQRQTIIDMNSAFTIKASKNNIHLPDFKTNCEEEYNFVKKQLISLDYNIHEE